MPKKIESVYTHWKPLKQAEFNELMLDFYRFCADGSMIIDKNGMSVPMILNEAQVAVADLIIQEVFAEIPSPVNILIHKSRQMGISVLIAKIEQFLCSRKKNLNCQHIMPAEPDADDLCDKKFVPQIQGTHPTLVPETHQIKRRVKFLEFGGVKLDSSVSFASAEKHSPGHGQPLDDDTPVPTPNGFVRHGDLKRGDTVFDKHGSPCVVEAVYPQGIIKLYRVTLSDGSYLDAGASHRWEVYKSSGAGPSVMQTTELIKRLAQGKRTMLSRNGAVEYTRKDLPLAPYKLGLLLGDGRLDEAGRAFIYSMDKEILDEFDGDIKSQPNNRSYRKYCRGLIPVIKSLGLVGHDSYTKFIPQEYLYGDIAQRKSLLAGLLDTDGGISGGCIEYTTVSPQLAEDVALLARSLGVRCKVISRVKTQSNMNARYKQYRLMMSSPFNPFRIKRKADRWYPPRNIKKISVVSVKLVSIKSAQCLAVNSLSHTYLAGERFMVTHNTNQVVIEDEHAMYTNVERLEKGMIATMPKVGLSLRVVVSTANGMNHFYDTSKVAKSSKHWKYLFLPWHMLKEYELEPQGRLKDLTHLTEYELKLCDIFEKAGYPTDTWARKMQWYQYVFETEAKLDENHMFANYPSTPEESFSATGSPVLPEKVLHQFKEANKKFTYVEISQDIHGKAQILPTTLSTIKQYEKPYPGRRYLLGADPADGGSDGDFSSGVVIDLTSMEVVCCVKEKLDQNEFAELLNHLGRHYNNAQIVPERNTGQTLIDWLVMLRYPNIFIDALHTTKSRVVYGVYTTTAIKNDAIRRLKFLLNAGIYKDYDPDFIEEGLHFTWKKTHSGIQKAVGSDGHGDDCVMSRLIAVATLNMSKYKDYGRDYGKDNQNG